MRLGGQHNDGKRFSRLLFFQPTEQLYAATAGKHPVEQHDIRLIVGDPPIGLVNIRSLNTLEI